MLKNAALTLRMKLWTTSVALSKALDSRLKYLNKQKNNLAIHSKKCCYTRKKKKDTFKKNLISFSPFLCPVMES